MKSISLRTQGRPNFDLMNATEQATVPQNDSQKFKWIRENLRVPAVCDILDDLGHRDRAMHHRLRPLDPECCSIGGRARTFRWMETDYVVESNPYGLEIDAMDSLISGDVAVHSCDPG